MGKNKKKTGKKAKSHPHVEDVDETVNKPEEIINSVNVTVPPKMSTDPEADGIVASPDDEGKDLSEGVDKQKVNDGLTVDTINPLEDKKAGDEMKELREEIERLKLELSYKKDQETPNEDFKNELANVIKERDDSKHSMTHY